MDVGWESAAHDLNSLLSVVIRPNVTRDIRQKALERADLYTRVDPAEYVAVSGFITGAILAGLPGAKGPSTKAPSATEASSDWRLGWAKRGQTINEKYGDPTFPPNYPVIDKIPDGIATSIKSIDLNAATYHKEQSLTYRIEKYVEAVRDFNGADWGDKIVWSDDIAGRALQLVVPQGSVTEAQRLVIEAVRTRVRQSNRPVDITITEH